MPRLIEFEGQTHEFPDDVTDAEISVALSRYIPPTPPLPPGSKLDPQPAAPRPSTPPLAPGSALSRPNARVAEGFDQFANAPIRVEAPGGVIVEFPANTSREKITEAMRRHFGGPEAQQQTPPLPPGNTLDPSPAVPTTAAIPPLPPGYKLDPPVRQPRFIPVDHDPFAQPAPRVPTYTSVDHDPFATPAPVPRLGMFDDLIPQPQKAPGISFDDLIPQQGAPAVSPESGRPRVYIGGSPQSPEPSAPTAMHSLAVGAQGVGAGLRDIVTMPFDLAAGAVNAGAGLINRLAGTNIPAATPASKMIERAVGPYSIPESEMSSSEKLGYNMNRFGTQALAMGSMLAARAPAVAAKSMPSSIIAERTADAFSRPYVANSSRTLTGDAVGGAGAGAAVNAADELLPTEPTTTTGSVVKGIASVLAPLVGGLGANAALSTTESLGGMLRNVAQRVTRQSDPNIPLNPRTHEAYGQADVERAASQLQAGTLGAPRAVARDIRENAAELTNPIRSGETAVDASALPTSGLLSRDPGLVTLESGSRLKNRGEFVQRDQNVKEAAATRVDSLRDDGADLSSVFRRADDVRAERLAPAEDAVRRGERDSSAIDQVRREQGAEFGAVANSEAKANASRNLDRAIVDEGYVPARAEKNRLFDTAPGRNEQLPADDVFAAIDRVRAGANGLARGALPEEFMQRLDRLRPRIDPTTGENFGGPGTALGGDLADLRKYLNTAQQAAQRGGNFDLADNIGVLRRSINQAIGDAAGYAEANANYGRFADRYRPNQTDELAKFTRELDRSGNTDGLPNRGSTPPSETAERFLSSPEKAQSLQRAIADAPNAQEATAAVRDFYRSNFASSALNDDGTVRPARAAAWLDRHSDVLSQFPKLRSEFEGYIKAAQRGEQLSTTAANDLKQARAALKSTEAEIDRGAIGTLLREDPRDVASSLLTGGYGAEKRLKEIQSIVKNDEAATRGWKAAVAEVLADKVQGARMVGETPEVQFARLAKEFKDNEKLLASTFSPEEMNGLRQAHKLLEYFKEAEKRASVGSNTADKWNIPAWAQLAVRHFKGDLAGGGLIKRFKLLLEQLPSNKQSADEIVQMAWFNPDVAAYLLERPIRNPNVPGYNINLRRLLAVDAEARGEDMP